MESIPKKIYMAKFNKSNNKLEICEKYIVSVDTDDYMIEWALGVKTIKKDLMGKTEDGISYGLSQSEAKKAFYKNKYLERETNKRTVTLTFFTEYGMFYAEEEREYDASWDDYYIADDIMKNEKANKGMYIILSFKEDDKKKYLPRLISARYREQK